MKKKAAPAPKKAPAKKAKEAKDPNKPKRPASAFFVFMYVIKHEFSEICTYLLNSVMSDTFHSLIR